MKAIPLTGELVGVVIVKVSVDGAPGVTTVGSNFLVTTAWTFGHGKIPSTALTSEVSTLD